MRREPSQGAFLSGASNIGWGGGSPTTAAAAGFLATESTCLRINAKEVRAIDHNLRSLGRLALSGAITWKTDSKVVINIITTTRSGQEH